MTIAYPDGIKPTPLSALSGQFPKEVHIHLKRIPIEEFPQDKEGITQKCYDLFTEKDKLLEHFKTNKHFPRKSKQETGINSILLISVTNYCRSIKGVAKYCSHVVLVLGVVYDRCYLRLLLYK